MQEAKPKKTREIKEKGSQNGSPGLDHTRRDHITKDWAAKRKKNDARVRMDMQAANVKKSKPGKEESPNFFNVKEPFSDSFT
jgi:hypothetical protein